MKRLKFFIKLFCSIILGFVITVYIAQYQTKLKTYISNHIKKHMREFLNSNIEFNITEVRIFPSHIKIENALIKPISNEENWFWSCKNISFDFSLIDVIFFKQIKPKIIINNLQAYSPIKNNNLEIGPHFKKLLFAGNNPALPMTIKLLKLKKSNIVTEDKNLNLLFQIKFDSETSDFDKTILKSRVNIHDGYLNINNINHCSNISAILNLGIFYNGLLNNFSIDGIFDLVSLNSKENKCFFISKWNSTANNCLSRLFTIDGQNILKILFTDLKSNNKKINISLNSDLLLLKNFFQMNQELTGRYDLNLNIDYNDFNKFDGKYVVNNLYLNKILMTKHLEGTFDNNSNLIGKIKFNSFDYNVDGQLDWDHDKSTGKILLNGKNKENNLSIDLSVNKLLNYDGQLNIKFNNLDLESTINGSDKELNLKVILDSSNIKNWLTRYSNFFTGQGKLEINGHCNENGSTGTISLKNGNIVLPEIHNIIKEINGNIEINIKEKRIILRNLIINLYKGEINCKLATIIFDETDPTKIKFLHCPIILKNCFFNLKNNLFSKLSGRLLIKKRLDSKADLSGYIHLNKTHVKDNILSNEFRNEIFANSNPNNSSLLQDLNIDISILSEKPIPFKTKFLESFLDLDLHLKKIDSEINLLGQIKLHNGKILLPYKELKILEGKIKFFENELTNPLINLIATNNIKDHNITLQISGTAQDPQIVLESRPKLTEEQIISLLLIGSKEDSLNFIVPTLLIENIKNIALTSDKSQESLYQYFKVLLKPFKYLKLIPEFKENQTLTAKLDLDINERLNATIQKKLNSKERTKISLDYMLSDDISIKANRDEIGNLSSDLELRWKF